MEPSIVEARAARLVAGVLAPLTRMARLTIFAFGLATVAGLLAGLWTRQPIVCAVVGLDVALLGALVAWWPCFDPWIRDAIEVVYDHDHLERAQWKAETGTSLPRGIRAARRWLAKHPEGPGRASMLLRVGRLEEADRAMAATVPGTPEAAFDLEILRRTRTLYAGGDPDLAPLHDAWPSLPDPRARRHRRECLGLLDAQLAVAHGRDALPLLAATRAEIGAIDRSVRAPWLLMRWSILALLLIGSATLFVVVTVS
jgi:hypothetical protein